MTKNRFLSAVALLLLFGSAASADSVPVTIVCNNVVYGPALIVNCPTLAGTAGMVNGGGGTVNGAGAVNSFLDTLTPGTLNTTLGYTPANVPPNNISINGPGPNQVSSALVWTTSPSGVYLWLNGTVYFPGQYIPATLTLTLTGTVVNGVLGAPLLTNNGVGQAVNCTAGNTLCIIDTISTANYPNNLSQNLPISVIETAPYNNNIGADTATETLTIATTGGVIYTNDDTFAGAAPEPASLALFVPGLLLVLLMVRRHKAA